AAVAAVAAIADASFAREAGDGESISVSVAGSSGGRGSRQGYAPAARIVQPTRDGVDRLLGSMARRDPAQDRRQDPALLVIADIDRAVEPGDGLEAALAATVGVVLASHDRQPLSRGEALGQAVDRVRLATGKSKRGRALARLELERQDAHPDEVRAMDPLEALGEDRPDPEQHRALRRPVARRTGTVLAA